MLPNQRPDWWGGFGLPSFFNLGGVVTYGRLDSSFCSVGRNVHFIPMKKLIVILVLFFPAVSMAAYTTTPRHPTTYVMGADGNWQAWATMQSVSNAGGPSKYVTRPVALSAASAGKMARAAMGGPLGLGILAATVFSDLQFDSSTEEFKEVTTHEPPFGTIQTSCTTVAQVGCRDQSGTRYCGYTKLYASADRPPGTPACGRPEAPAGSVLLNNCTSYSHCSGYFPQKRQVVTWTGTTSQYPASIEEVTAILTDEQIGTLAQSDPAVMNEILRDSLNRNTWQDEWPELVTALEAVSAALDNFYEGDQTNYDETIVDSATDNAPEYGSEFSLEFPEFCSWASVVCTFIDWVMSEPVEPEPVEVPVVETELEEWDSGLGLGSCPAGYAMTYNGQSHTFEYTNICWGAETIFKPILIVLSLISAAYILIGARQ